MLNPQGHPGESLATSAPPPESREAGPGSAPVAPRLATFQVADRERRGGGRRGRSRRRRWLWLLLMATLAGSGWAVWSRLSQDRLPEFETYTFTGKPTRHILLDLTGSIVPRTRIVISPQVGGIVSKVHLPLEGQKVQGGALLFEIENTRYRADYLQAEAGLTAAKAQLLELENGTRTEEIEEAAAAVDQAKEHVALTKLEWQRTRDMYARKAVSPSDLDKNRTLHLSALKRLRLEQAKYDLARHGPRPERIAASRAEVQRAEATRVRARYYYDQTKIYAPAAGTGTSFTLLERKVAPGESIQADLTYTALCTLADLKHMEAEIDVQERDLGVLKIGGPCEIIPDAYPERTYRGHVNRKQPIVNRQRGVVQVKITIDEPDEYLLPNMNARVLLLEEKPRTGAAPDLPEIPRRALVADDAPPAVFVVEGQTARLRRIELGTIHGDWAQVRKGLQAEDRIILPGDRPLVDGQPVRVRGMSRKEGGGRKGH